MALENKTLTDRERAALYLHIYGRVDDWKTLFLVAYDGTLKDAAKVNYLETYVSKWRNSKKVKECLENIRYYQMNDREKLIQDTRQQQREEDETILNGDNERTKTKKAVPVVDYSDPENRKRLYNEVISKAGDDPKTQLDAAKMFEQIQKDDKQAAREQKQVRAYLPILCHDCPLYQKERDK